MVFDVATAYLDMLQAQTIRKINADNEAFSARLSNMEPRVPTFSESRRHTLKHEHFKRLASSRRADGSPKRDPMVALKKNFENAIKQQGFKRISILNQSTTTPTDVPLTRAKRSLPFNVDNIKKHKLSSQSVIK